MAQVSDSRPTSSAQTSALSSTQSNIQDVFLNHARRDRLVVALQLMDGRRLDAVIKSFDRFAVIVEIDGGDHLIFKHAIATIETSRTLSTYASPV
jgi:host factor-I protein